jgi:hypothetical protein
MVNYRSLPLPCVHASTVIAPSAAATASYAVFLTAILCVHFFVGSTAFLNTDWFQFSGSTISSQHGDFYAHGFNNPAQPSFPSNLQPVASKPASSNASPRFAAIAVDNQTAYLASTTSTGGNPNGGQAAVQGIDISNPANMAVLSQDPFLAFRR